MIVLTAAIVIYPYPAAAQRAASVFDVRVGHHADKTRVVLDVSEDFGFHYSLSPGGDAVVIDLPAVQWQAGRSSRRHRKGLVSDYRFGSVDSGGRLVIKVDGPVHIKKAMTIAPGSASHYRYVLDIGMGAGAEPAMAAGVPKAAAFRSQSAQTIEPAQRGYLASPERRLAQTGKPRPVQVASLHTSTPGMELAQSQEPETPPIDEERLLRQYRSQGILPSDGSPPEPVIEPEPQRPIPDTRGIKKNGESAFFSTENLKFSVTPRVQYFTISTDDSDDEQLEMPFYGISVGIRPLNLTNTDFITSLFYGQTSTRSNLGFTTLQTNDVSRIDLEFTARHFFEESDVYWTWGGRYIGIEVEEKLENPNLTFSDSGTNTIEEKIDAFGVGMGLGFASKILPDQNLSLFGGISFGLFGALVEDNKIVDDPEEGDIGFSYDLNMGVQWTFDESLSSHLRYRYISLTDNKDFFKGITGHGPEIGLTYRF